MDFGHGHMDINHRACNAGKKRQCRMGVSYMVMSSPPASRYPKLQEVDVQQFLPFASKHLGWKDLSGDLVMDVGCGTGDNSTRQLVTLCPNVGKIVAIDHITTTISMAKQMHSHPKIEYRVANIEDSSTLTPWIGNMSKVVSANCFTFLSNQRAAFENVYKLLKPGGEAAILFSLQSCYLDTFMELMEQPRWKEYFKNITTVVPESHSNNFDASHYIAILKDIGFTIILCQDEHKSYFYQSDADCKKSVTSCLLADQIPIEQREEFREEIFQTFLKYNPKGSSPQPRLNYRVLSVLVRKLETTL